RIAFSTRSRRFFLTWLLLLTTADTVNIETPDSRATSEILAALGEESELFFFGRAIRGRHQDNRSDFQVKVIRNSSVYDTSGSGRSTSRTNPSRSWQAVINWRSVLRVGPNVSKSSTASPSSA